MKAWDDIPQVEEQYLGFTYILGTRKQADFAPLT
jgi:hypothetical protein